MVINLGYLTEMIFMAIDLITAAHFLSIVGMMNNVHYTNKKAGN